jgi:hypothetical protein
MEQVGSWARTAFSTLIGDRGLCGAGRPDRRDYIGENEAIKAGKRRCNRSLRSEIAEIGYGSRCLPVGRKTSAPRPSPRRLSGPAAHGLARSLRCHNLSAFAQARDTYTARQWSCDGVFITDELL